MGERIEGEEIISGWLLVEIQPIPNASGFSLFHQEINIGGIKTWISSCEKDHGGVYHTIKSPGTKMPDTTDL